MNKPRMSSEAVEAIERQKTLLQISRFYNPDFKRTWESITELATPVLHSDRTSIWSLTEDGSRMICEDLFICSTSEHSSGMELDSNLYPSYFNAMETSRYIDASDGENDPRTSEFTTGYLLPLNIKSLLDVPIRLDGKLSGVICFEYVGEIHTWSLEEKEFAASMADLVSAKFEALERSRTEKELASSEMRYRNILDHAMIGIFRNTLDGSIVYANDAMAAILEYESVEELCQAKAFDFYPSKEAREEMVQTMLEKKSLRNLNLLLISKKGNPKQCVINSFLEGDQIVGMIMDNTTQQTILKDLEESKVLAEASDRLKTSLLANMSHELRTPMNSILGFSELMMNDTDNEETQSYCIKIHNAGKRLMHTLKTILELADMETTRSKLDLKEVNLLKILSSILPPFQSMAREKGLYLVSKLDLDITVIADDKLIKPVIQNLIDNAIKFTDEGGVTIDTSLQSKNGTDWVLIRVKDTGIGIEPEDFDHIFQEFRQASEGYNRRYEGTGLGLTLSNKMTHLMGGEITVESELGSGSLFTIWLPVSGVNDVSNVNIVNNVNNVNNVNSVNSVSEGAIADDIPSILVVEDNEDNAELVKLYLKDGCHIDRASDSATALQMADNKQYQVVLLDINLGIGMDGLQFVEELRTRKSYIDTPIIAITGYTMDKDREKIMNTGCTHYIAKPFTKSMIVNELTKALNTTKKS
ncbi:ATP-binding protein [Bacteroidota bacterium]